MIAGALVQLALLMSKVGGRVAAELLRGADQDADLVRHMTNADCAVLAIAVHVYDGKGVAVV